MMKTVALKSLLVSALAFMMLVPVMSQKGVDDGSKYGQGQDSINCLMNLSLYREFFKHNNYNDAIRSWRKAFNECPASSENMYVDGVKMYKKFISGEKNPDVVDAYVDTIMLIYDQRITYFNDEANVLGRKAIDLLRYRKDNIESIEQSYNFLGRSIRLDPDKARDAVLILFTNASVSLNKAGVITVDDAIEDYFLASQIIDEQLDKNPNNTRFTRAKENVDELMLDANIMNCDALNRYYEPKFEANKNDEAFLNNMIDFYYTAACDRSDMYVMASEQLYKINPSHESAYKLARLLVAKETYDKASQYYKEAVSGDADNDTKAQYYYELAQVTRVLGNTCEAIEYAREAVKNDPGYGNAFILLGDLYIESRENLGDEFEQRTAFWAAADKYIQAKNVDASTASDANKRISDYASQYPDGEAIFFRTLQEGDSYLVKGCINEYTTVRPRK
ncbi:MAG: tetratricopeptide repeat protein [Bacteroidales bacterium]|nr:tetratricopeptide repeat protein [Bacteroidales bacterium]